MRNRIYFLPVGRAFILGGCASAGLAVSSHHTDVGLSANNYRIVATNLSGESTSKGLFGFSYGFGLVSNQVVLNPLSKKRLLYKNATRNLWENFEDKFGNPAGRTLALVNVRYDSETMNTFFYT